MPEKFSIKDVARDDHASSMILFKAMVSCCEGDIRKKFNIPETSITDRSIEVCLTVNGVEVPLRPVFEDLMKNLNKMASRHAKELFENELGKFNEAVYDLNYDMKHAFNKMLDKIGIDLENEETL